MEYILSSTAQEAPTSECIFCDMQSAGDDRSRLLVYRGERTMAVLNKFPYNNGHLLVMPKAHVSHYNGLDEATFAELHQLLHKATNVLEESMRCHGMNIGLNYGQVAGAGIPGHMHYHLVPRWNGDTNFMAVTGMSKVISQHLLDTYDQLKPLFA
ncbi:MAG: hypothetical protein A2289_25375 [Deltaproteobacteria bacterium RIFOXYA12_FULL_58_15]|nr:MAG: hypothetical protein A2289_25375 [Deltaproteobacteria bacterium RIFOXYA12_FULL_58_15]OGR12158.1 MAG: hypothetical protein A2341_24125 [Deltaproteobacteria bacterium RIFOXYB12_FULL_58_9]